MPGQLQKSFLGCANLFVDGSPESVYVHTIRYGRANMAYGYADEKHASRADAEAAFKRLSVNYPHKIWHDRECGCWRLEVQWREPYGC